MKSNGKREDIICFSTQPWDDPLWTNKQHIMSRLSKERKVLYVNPRPVSLNSMICKRLIGKDESYCHIVKKSERLWVLNELNLIPFDRFRIVKRANEFLRKIITSIIINWFADRNEFVNRILWVYSPHSQNLIRNLNKFRVVYDCVDECSEFPENGNSIEKLIGDEVKLLGMADIVFTTSEQLFSDKSRFNDSTFLVHNVGDFDHFRNAMNEELGIPVDIGSIKKPILGFVGAISEYKIDFDLLSYIAEVRRNWSLVLIGPVGVADSKTDISRLRKFSNVHFLGIRDYSKLPAYIKGFDVCIIPYRLNRYTSGCFPIKFFEFLATGKPVVVTMLSSLKKFRSEVCVARDKEEFVTMCESAICNDTDDERKRRLRLAERNSWEDRISKMLEIISEH